MKEKVIIFLQNIKHRFILWMNNLKRKFKSIDFRSKRFWFKFFVVFLSLIVAGFITLLILFAWFSKDLPSPSKVVRREGYTSQIYDRNGKIIYDLYNDAKRTPVTWNNIPDTLKQATIAVEDKSFYTHSGIDLLTPFRIIKNFFYRFLINISNLQFTTKILRAKMNFAVIKNC